jgi:rfaE bifunctional protein kinase chain/domain
MSVQIDQLFAGFSDVKIGVIGDVMLDAYMWGHVERISPEAPVPIVALDKKENRLGGAANVALNAKSLGSQVFMLSVVGDDDSGAEMIQLLKQNEIGTDYLIKDNQRITTTKTRIISRNQQMMRLDHEITDELSREIAVAFIQNVRSFIEKEKPQVIVFEDYNKGVLTSHVIQSVIDICKSYNVLMTVDPKKHNFFAYQGVHIFKPNLKEVREALHLSVDKVDKEQMQKVHQLLQEKLGHQISFITLSEKGVFYQDGEYASLIPTHVRSIADVSGAGDTVIATASIVYALTHDAEMMASIANIAGGLVCEEVGTVSINKERLLHECKLVLHI